mmetsp:Transcript_24659/g.53414  ORF Transcript_24659/g.53414 Transcript_24659/m.53414 type:complete len:275 (-) Transcript_24659:1070-1894(-)
MLVSWVDLAVAWESEWAWTAAARARRICRECWALPPPSPSGVVSTSCSSSSSSFSSFSDSSSSRCMRCSSRCSRIRLRRLPVLPLGSSRHRPRWTVLVLVLVWSHPLVGLGPWILVQHLLLLAQLPPPTATVRYPGPLRNTCPSFPSPTLTVIAFAPTTTSASTICSASLPSQPTRNTAPAFPSPSNRSSYPASISLPFRPRDSRKSPSAPLPTTRWRLPSSCPTPPSCALGNASKSPSTPAACTTSPGPTSSTASSARTEGTCPVTSSTVASA